MPDPTAEEAEAELAQAELVITDPKAPKRAGRPPGLPKTGGRVRGTPNRVNAISRDFIISHGAPVEILCKIAKGEKIQAAADAASSSKRQGIYPTLDQRLAAARILASKIVPDLKSVEHAGEDGGNLVIRIVRFGDAA